MSQGLPVIYTRGQGFDGQFSEGEVGYSVDPNSPDEIASKIKAVLGDYERLSKRALEAADRYTWGMICKEYLRLYSSAVKLH